MTDMEKEKIRYLRGEGLGYKAIASRLALSENTVKSFCRRNGLSGICIFYCAGREARTLHSIVRRCLIFVYCALHLTLPVSFSSFIIMRSAEACKFNSMTP